VAGAYPTPFFRAPDLIPLPAVLQLVAPLPSVPYAPWPGPLARALDLVVAPAARGVPAPLGLPPFARFPVPTDLGVAFVGLPRVLVFQGIPGVFGPYYWIDRRTWVDARELWALSVLGTTSADSVALAVQHSAVRSIAWRDAVQRAVATVEVAAARAWSADVQRRILGIATAATLAWSTDVAGRAEPSAPGTDPFGQVDFRRLFW
jgi:hypothetical protein